MLESGASQTQSRRTYCADNGSHGCHVDTIA
jgi:hypothetical protein